MGPLDGGTAPANEDGPITSQSIEINLGNSVSAQYVEYIQTASPAFLVAPLTTTDGQNVEVGITSNHLSGRCGYQERRRQLKDGFDSISDRQTGRLWACPFYKLDSSGHYRCLEKYKLKRYADVKQHIRRCHPLSGSNANVLKNEGGRGTEQQKWYRLWDSLFQGHQQPSSPFVKDGLAEPIALLRNRAAPLLAANLPTLFQHVTNIPIDASAVHRLGNEIQRLIFEVPAAPQRDYGVCVTECSPPQPTDDQNLDTVRTIPSTVLPQPPPTLHNNWTLASPVVATASCLYDSPVPELSLTSEYLPFMDHADYLFSQENSSDNAS